MNKSETLKDPNSCLNKAHPTEPVFVLRAKDEAAAQAVRHWATMAHGVHEPAKIKEALAVADVMDKWRKHHHPPEVAGGEPLQHVRG